MNKQDKKHLPQRVIDETKKVARERQAIRGGPIRSNLAWSEVYRSTLEWRADTRGELCRSVERLANALIAANGSGLLEARLNQLLPATATLVRIQLAGPSAADLEEGLNSITDSSVEELVLEELRDLHYFVLRELDVKNRIAASVSAVMARAPLQSGRPRLDEEEAIELKLASERLAILRRTTGNVLVRGPSLVRLLQLVLTTHPRASTWVEIAHSWADHHQPVPEAQWRPPPAPRSLMKYGTKIKSSLGELGVYWSQDASGVQWTGPRITVSR